MHGSFEFKGYCDYHISGQKFWILNCFSLREMTGVTPCSVVTRCNLNPKTNPHNCILSPFDGSPPHEITEASKKLIHFCLESKNYLMPYSESKVNKTQFTKSKSIYQYKTTEPQTLLAM
jgi:hypothetical protein